MSIVPASPTRSGNRTFQVTCVILTGISLAQGAALAVAWNDYRHQPPAKAIASVKPAPLPSVKAGPVAKPPGPDPFASPAPFEESAAAAEAMASALKSEGTRIDVPVVKAPGTVPAEPVLLKPVVKTTAPLDTPITDEACLRHLDEGIYLRGRGEMQGALTELRAALAMLPDHPQLLYQTARTYDMMIQEQKSVLLWEKLRKLGPAAGNCYQLAVARLKELAGVTPAVSTDNDEEKAGRFALGEVSVERLVDTAHGEILRFHASVRHLGSEPVDVSKIWMKLHLFDMVNGQHIDRTTAVPAVPVWLDAPVDWADGTEKFDFEYRQPPLSADEIVKLGQRKYYGYAVELRYGESGEEKFEDMVAEPRELGDFARELPEDAGPAAAGPAGAMEAPVSGGKPGQPDGTLFPGDKFDR